MLYYEYLNTVVITAWFTVTDTTLFTGKLQQIVLLKPQIRLSRG